MAEQDSNTINPGDEKSDKLFEGLLLISDDPEKMSIFGKYLDLVEAARDGRLSQEGMARFKELNAFIHRIHRAVAEGGAA